MRSNHISDFVWLVDPLNSAQHLVRNRVKRQMEKTQREYYLNEQMKAIQKELGESEDGASELDELETKLKALKLPKVVLEKGEAELKKLRNMGPMSAEATVVRNYLDWITAPICTKFVNLI